MQLDSITMNSAPQKAFISMQGIHLVLIFAKMPYQGMRCDLQCSRMWVNLSPLRSTQLQLLHISQLKIFDLAAWLHYQICMVALPDLEITVI